jgi:predicted lipid-binding transport protein (Tim44 family)
MLAIIQRCTPFLLVFFALTFMEAGIRTEYADARSKSGGRSFSSPANRPAQQQAPSQVNQRQQQSQPGGFGRGLMGGLLGGAIGAMLFGSLFGAAGSGMGMLLPMLLLGGVGYFLYRRFANRPAAPTGTGYQPPSSPNLFQGGAGSFGGSSVPPISPVSPTTPLHAPDALEQGLAEIRFNDPGFDEKYFLDVASDVFFQVQAGWMRKDLSAYRHLLGRQLAEEYDRHFAKMQELGQSNKLESIAVRKVEIVAAGSDNGEDFLTVLFTANLLDYTVDDQTGAVVEGSMTEPVKFAEKWTWARPIRTEEWKLEGVEVVED